MGYLYRHIRLDTNEVFYIGIGGFDKLEKKFTYKRAKSKRRNKWWKNIINVTNYNIEIMLEDLSWEEACEKEREFIKLYGRKDKNEGTLVNLTDGGDGVLGIKKSCSDETRQKISLANKGKKKWQGKHHSDETKKKISDLKKGNKNSLGRKLSEETKQKIGNSNKGRKSFLNGKHTSEAKEKISQSKRIRIICNETGEIFKSIKDASIKTGINYYTLVQNVNGLFKSKTGLTFTKLE